MTARTDQLHRTVDLQTRDICRAVESRLRQHPRVLECSVVEIRDSRPGLNAFIVPDRWSCDLTPELKQLLSSDLEPEAVPRFFTYFEQLPLPGKPASTAA